MKKIMLTIMAIFIISSFAGCIGDSAPVDDEFTTVKIVDTIGREVEVPKEVNSIVCVGSGSLRLLTYLDAVDMISGVEYSETKPTGRPYSLANTKIYSSLPIIGQGGSDPKPNPEAIIAVNPDVLFITYVDKQTADELQLQTGVPVVVLSYGGASRASFEINTVYESLTLAGDITGTGKRAEDVIEYMKQNFEDLNQRTKNITENEKPTVYLGGIAKSGSQGITSTQYKFLPFEALSAKNVVNELELGKSPQQTFVDKERLISWNPNYIFIDEGSFNGIKEEYEKNPELFNSFTAFNGGNTHAVLPITSYTINIGTLLADSYYIGKTIYPDQFNDINSEEKADEIYGFLVGKGVYNQMKSDYGGFGKIDSNTFEIK